MDESFVVDKVKRKGCALREYCLGSNLPGLPGRTSELQRTRRLAWWSTFVCAPLAQVDG